MYEHISNSVHESSLLKLELDEELKLDYQESITLNNCLTSPETKKEIPTKTYIDSSSENIRKRRNMSTMFNDQDIEFSNIKFTNNIDPITINRKPNSDSAPANKKYIDEEIDKPTAISLNQILEKHSEVRVGDKVFALKNKKSYRFSSNYIF